jgi:hypothetical protein
VLYTRVIQTIFEKTGERPNFKNCCFAAAYFNFQRAFSLDHYDHLNFYCGLCAVFNTTTFDPSKSGHIVLWELGLVIEFPPGCSCFFPSAAIKHCNVGIDEEETRWAFVQFTAAALVRWVHNGGLTDEEFMLKATSSQKKEWHEHRNRLGQIGLDLLK